MLPVVVQAGSTRLFLAGLSGAGIIAELVAALLHWDRKVRRKKSQKVIRWKQSKTVKVFFQSISSQPTTQLWNWQLSVFASHRASPRSTDSSVKHFRWFCNEKTWYCRASSYCLTRGLEKNREWSAALTQRGRPQKDIYSMLSNRGN